jgi:hypothetical protein
LLRFLLWLPGWAWNTVWRHWLPVLWYPASFLRSHRQLVSLWPEGGIQVGPRVALFAHFDRGGAMRAHTLAYLSALRDAGLSVVLVTNAGRLRPEAMAALQTSCAGVIVRRNVGYDFGALREGIEILDLPRPDTEMLLLANDSVYGPLQPLGPVLERLDFTRADLWGLTESWQTRYHLQSYFLAIGRAALTSPAWTEFWRGVRPVSSKWWVIRHYEIGLTQRLLRAGLRAQALWRYQDLTGGMPAAPKLGPEFYIGDDDIGEDDDPRLLDPLARQRLAQLLNIRKAMAGRRALNPTSDFWRQLLDAGFPFLKRELLRLNPGKVGDLADWREVVRANSGADLDAIERDLQRVMRNRAP